MDKSGHTISVIICAYTADRWHDICEAIQSVRDQSLKPHEIILVVDHNPALFERARGEFHDLVVIENRGAQGLSGARNTGVAAASGSLLAFLDDDAIADRHWLSRLMDHCRSPHVLGASAKVDPIWIGKRPDWFPDEFLWTIGCTYRGSPTEARQVRNVFGGAMMLKREVFDRIGEFSVDLGRQKSGVLLSCEETELCIRANIAFPDRHFIIEPSSVIGHKIPASRLNWRYFRRRCYAEGISKAYITSRFAAHDPLETERNYMFRTLSSGFGRALSDFLLRLDMGGLKRAAAIVLGVTSTGAGFLKARLQSADASSKTEIARVNT